MRFRVPLLKAKRERFFVREEMSDRRQRARTACVLAVIIMPFLLLSFPS